MLNKADPILLVEDSVDDFEATVRAFKKADLSNPLAHVTSGEDALTYLRSEAKPCLIILDLNMPGMGGRKFLEKVKQDASFREIPVVVLTTSNYAPDIKACYALGANAYILKQADFNVLAVSIKRLKEYWLDTVVLPRVFDEDIAGANENAGSLTGVKTTFAVSDGTTGADAPSADALNAVHLSAAEVKEKIKATGPLSADTGDIKLEPHEIETLNWIARGKSRWETGTILGVSEDTIKARLEKIRQKLGASNTTHAIAIALSRGLLQH